MQVQGPVPVGHGPDLIEVARGLGTGDGVVEVDGAVELRVVRADPAQEWVTPILPAIHI
jgi:hypothetical protein